MSDTVKLIIEIPKEIMEYVKNNDCLSVIYIDEIAKVIQNGTPLDDIKSAIENKYDDFANSWCEFEQGKNEMINEVLEMLEEV